jgi:hypothetical protein
VALAGVRTAAPNRVSRCSGSGSSGSRASEHGNGSGSTAAAASSSTSALVLYSKDGDIRQWQERYGSIGDWVGGAGSTGGRERRRRNPSGMTEVGRKESERAVHEREIVMPAFGPD